MFACAIEITQLHSKVQRWTFSTKLTDLHCSLIWAPDFSTDCILDITSCMSQRHFKLKLNVPNTKIIISFTPQNLVPFQGSVSELIHHPSYCTSEKPIRSDIIFSLCHIQCIIKFCPFYLFNVSPLHLHHHYYPTHSISRGQHWPPHRAKRVHSGPFQSVLCTLARDNILEHKTSLSHACLI